MLKRRLIGTTIFSPSTIKRVPLLEELTEGIVCKNSHMDELSPSTYSEVLNYKAPLSKRMIEASLSSEFSTHITRTDWNDYQNPLKKQELLQGARLLQRTLLSQKAGRCRVKGFVVGWKGNHNVNFVDMRGRSSLFFLAEESPLLEKEMESGDYSRWTEPSSLVDGWDSISDGVKKLLLPAIQLISKNVDLHPTLKKEVLRPIVEGLIQTNK